MFGISRRHPGEIEVKALLDMPDDAFELARLWLSPSAGRSYVAISRFDHWSPELVGSLLIECAHNAAESYAATGQMTYSESLAEICHGIDEERVCLVELDGSNDKY